MIIKASLSKGAKYAFVSIQMDFITFSRHAEKLYFRMSPNRVERHICISKCKAGM